MNPETAREDVLSLEPGRAVVYDEPLNLKSLRDDLIFYPVPFDKIVADVCTDAKLRRLVRNMIYDGVLSHLLSIDLAQMEKALVKQLGKKPKAMQLNMGALEAGKKYAARTSQIQHPYRVERLNKTDGPDSGRRQRRRPPWAACSPASRSSPGIRSRRRRRCPRR